MRLLQVTPNILRILGALFSLRIEISDVPLGRKLGRLNLPGALKLYINLELRILGFVVLFGHVELV